MILFEDFLRVLFFVVADFGESVSIIFYAATSAHEQNLTDFFSGELSHLFSGVARNCSAVRL